MKTINQETETPKKFLLTFRAERYRKRKIYVTCTEAELQGAKERWAMLLEEQTGFSWHCTNAVEVDARTVYVGNRNGGD